MLKPPKPGSRSGNTLLEFAIGSLLVVPAFVGTFQFGYTFFRYDTLESAVNSGALYASLAIYESSTTTPTSALLAAVRNQVVYGNPAGGTIPLLPGLATSNVNLEVAFTNGVPSAMTVYVTGYTIEALFGNLVCNNKPKARYPFNSIYAPPP